MADEKDVARILVYAGRMAAAEYMRRLASYARALAESTRGKVIGFNGVGFADSPGSTLRLEAGLVLGRSVILAAEEHGGRARLGTFIGNAALWLTDFLRAEPVEAILNSRTPRDGKVEAGARAGEGLLLVVTVAGDRLKSVSAKVIDARFLREYLGKPVRLIAQR